VFFFDRKKKRGGQKESREKTSTWIKKEKGEMGEGSPRAIKKKKYQKQTPVSIKRKRKKQDYGEKKKKTTGYFEGPANKKKKTTVQRSHGKKKRKAPRETSLYCRKNKKKVGQEMLTSLPLPKGRGSTFQQKFQKKKKKEADKENCTAVGEKKKTEEVTSRGETRAPRSREEGEEGRGGSKGERPPPP